MEFGMNYGNNGLDYADFKEIHGNVKVSKKNEDGDTIKFNRFDVPIIV